MWIKICGNTSFEDASVAVVHGANAVGFVFAESPRRVTPHAVRQITRQLPRNIEKYGVFVDTDFETIIDTVGVAGLTGVQLQTTADEKLAERLRQHYAGLPHHFSILQGTHFVPDTDVFAARLHAFHASGSVDAVLVDSRTATQVGGTGIAFDWKAARGIFLREAPHLRLIAAGGLKPENVKKAIHTLRPWGVDVASGVEAQPGRKDPDRVAAFIRTARMAAVKLNKTAAAAHVESLL